MTWKQRQESLFSAPASFLDAVRLHGPVTLRNMAHLQGSVTIPAGRAVAVDGGAVVRADSLDADLADSVIGVEVGGGYVAVAGEVTVLGAGWSFTPGSVIWSGPDGTLTESVPATGFQLRIGLATGPETILVAMGEPIVLT